MMLYRLYEQILQEQIRRRHMPGCVVLVLGSCDLNDSGLQRLIDLLDWCNSLDIGYLMIYVNDYAPQCCQKIAAMLREAPAKVELHGRKGLLSTGRGGKITMIISVGLGGKQEVTEAFQSLLEDVERGQVNPDDINEAMIESRLRFKQKPDLVIRAGGKQLSDFMLWQAAYSELYFTDVEWKSMRKIDFLRAIRDFQLRARRFGK